MVFSLWTVLLCAELAPEIQVLDDKAPVNAVLSPLYYSLSSLYRPWCVSATQGVRQRLLVSYRPGGEKINTGAEDNLLI